MRFLGIEGSRMMKSDKIKQLYKEWVDALERLSKEEPNNAKAALKAKEIDEKYRKMIKDALGY